MKLPPCKIWVYGCFAASLVLSFVAGITAAQTQNPNGTIRGQVTDPSGAAIAGASILLTTPLGASTDASTDKDGVYEFKGLPPGNYQIKAVVQGFALFTKVDVAVAAGQITRANISLTIEVEKEKVEVTSTTSKL